MSHYFEFDGIREKIYTILSIAYSGENFALEYQVGTGNKIALYSQKDYWIQTKSIVSNSILEIAIKVRNSCESIEHNDKTKTLSCIENSEVTSRDFIWVCNKIIHAKSFNLVPVGSHKYEQPLEWWDGEVDVSGEFYGKPWKVSFDAVSWLKACANHIKYIEKELKNLRDSSQDLVRCI